MNPRVRAATSRASALAQFALLAGLFAALLWRSWGKWPDVMVDFGRELYAPWRLAEGDVLFRDLAWFNGPLSPYLNASAFALFGVGLTTLVWLNVALFAASLALLHALLREFVSCAAASAGCALAIACCGFAQLVGIGNYNYVCPYSHEATHGVLLTLAALWTARRWTLGHALSWAAASGACAGLAFLTKPEMYVAALVGAIGALALETWRARTALAAQLRALGAFAAGHVGPPLAAFALLAPALGAEGAWRGVLGAWPSLFASDVAELAFYRVGMGLDRPLENTAAMLAWAAGWCALAALLAALGRAARAASPSIVLRALGFAALAAATWFALPALSTADAARGWPALVLLALLASAPALARRTADAEASARGAFALAALVMLAKMALNARLAHYGFALAMPATALLGALALDGVQRVCAARGWNGALAGGAMAGVLAGFASTHIAASERIFAMKSDAIGAGPDAFVADPRARAFNAALGWIEQQRKPGAPPPTLAVFPEGVMLNYLARLENPTPFVNFMPPEMVLFDEQRILQSFKDAPPELVVVTHKSTAEYGFRFFGVDYAKGLGAWLRAEYRAVQVFGDPPLQPGSRFGVAVLVRRGAN